jgi:hypothetical protein
MNYFLYPKKNNLINNDFTTDDINLGGCFYDYFRNNNGIIVGVRYYLMENVLFEKHPIYVNFIDDERFFFNQEEMYIDILFDVKNIDLTLDFVQDFGGESFIKNGNYFVICFSNLEN